MQINSLLHPGCVFSMSSLLVQAVETKTLVELAVYGCGLISTVCLLFVVTFAGSTASYATRDLPWSE